jgi:hypothetical protein
VDGNRTMSLRPTRPRHREQDHEGEAVDLARGALMRGLSYFILACAGLAGCAGQVQLDAHVPLGDQGLKIIDARPEAGKQAQRNSNFSAIAFFEDDKFQPKALDILVSDLAANQSVRRPATVEVNHFRVADSFPARLGRGFVMETLRDANTEWSLLDSAGAPRNQDSVIAIFSGRLNGREVRAAAFEPYRISPWTGLVHKDPDFRRAARESIQKLSQMIARQL